MEIDNESENRAELARRAHAASDKKLKSLIETRIEKSDGKLDSMTVLMLHYCAGLQHCLDQEETERLKQLEEERSRNDREAASDSMLEHDSSDQDNVVIVDYSSISAQGSSGQSDEPNILAAMLADGSENTKSEVELLATDLIEMEGSSEVEDEKVEDVTVVLDNRVAFSVNQTTVSLETEDDQRTETLAHDETTLAEMDATDVPMCSTEQVFDVEVSEVPTAAADLTVETSSSETVSHDSVACKSDDAL